MLTWYSKQLPQIFDKKRYLLLRYLFVFLQVDVLLGLSIVDQIIKYTNMMFISFIAADLKLNIFYPSLRMSDAK